MKKITIIYLVLILALPVLLQAQYGGGNGRGDVMLQLLNSPLTNTENNNNTIPESYSLEQNYPNPFNPTTKIKFELPSVADPLWWKGYGFSRGVGLVKLTVYDVMGREVATLVNETLKPGTYETTFDGSALSSGTYFYKLTSGDFTQTKRLTLLK